MPIIKWICVVFIEFIRGVPLITLLFVANVVLAYFLPPGTTFDLILPVIIMITMFASAYISEFQIICTLGIICHLSIPDNPKRCLL